ncbi:hypothetical protein GCM10009858_44170 [Terrabacter carboxydivorans]|uniref:Uncharacterized protein n=1 Tax=Terrabacter carboxydivorans TaxID=619730 RepID=A0ABN3MGY2_9MICO
MVAHGGTSGVLAAERPRREHVQAFRLDHGAVSDREPAAGQPQAAPLPDQTSQGVRVQSDQCRVRCREDTVSRDLLKIHGATVPE